MSESQSTTVPIRHKSGKSRRPNGRPRDRWGAFVRSAPKDDDTSSDEAEGLEGVAEAVDRGVETVASKLGPRSRLARGIRRAYGATRRHPMRTLLAGLAIAFAARLALVKRR